MRRPATVPAVLGLDLSLRGSGAVVLRGAWDPADPWVGFTHHRFTEEGTLEGAARRSAISLAVWRLAVREGVGRSFVEEHSFSKGLLKHAFARAELVGAVKEALWSTGHLDTVPVVASGARKLLFGAQRRMNSKEWKRFIEAGFTEMGAPPMDEDSRDAFVIANAGRHALGLPCLSCG